MARQQTKKQDELVNKARAIFDYIRNSGQYTTWWTQARADYGLYEGTGHWTADELEVLRQRKQAPSVINKFKPKIDALAGVEIQTRTQTAFRPRNAAKSAVDVAAAFSHLMAYHQERLDLVQYDSEAFKDGLIQGIGWGESDYDGYEVVGGWVDPLEMLWDVDDPTPDMSKQRKMARYRWMPLEDAIRQFEKHEDKLRQMADYNIQDGLLGGGLVSQSAGADYKSVIGQDFGYYDRTNGMVCIIEVLYKELETVYKVLTPNNTYACFLKEEDAKKFRAKNAKIEETKELVNKFVYYTDNYYLDSGTCIVQGKFFPYTPWVYARGRIDRVPYGLARAARYPQIEYNKRRSKALHLLNSRQVVMDNNAVESISDLQIQISRPDGVISKRPGSELVINDNTPLEASQVNLMNIATMELAEVTGIYDELMGQQTNTVSGVAQQRRQEASVRTHAFAFTLFKRFKKRRGEALLQVLLEAYKDETHVRIIGDNDLVKIIRLNAEDTEKNILNSTAGILLDVVVEQVPEYDSSPQEEGARLEQILMNGAGQFLTSPEIARALGFREPEKIAQSVQKLFAASQQPADAANAQAGAATANQPSLPQA